MLVETLQTRLLTEVNIDTHKSTLYLNTLEYNVRLSVSYTYFYSNFFQSTNAVPMQTAAAPLDPSLSFKAGITHRQQTILKCAAALVGISALLAPLVVATLLSWTLFFLFAVLITWRAFLVLVGALNRKLSAPDVFADPDTDDLPIYSVLIAAYNEAPVMRQLATALQHLQWPADRLDIQLLLEADDADTFRAANRAGFPASTRIVRVPAGGPRTKPNALNYGLAQARGRFVTVFDAEDLPHPRQILAAHTAFQKASARTVCVQAPLIADNIKSNWLTAHWGLEYQVQFGLLLPSTSLYRMPVLIGGTSNHFRRDALLALGGWDPYNVTEDADLGMRIARARLLTETITTPTYEDAPRTFSVWLSQRSRWIKGYMQTWMVLMRNPRKAARQMGWGPFAAMQFSLGGAILAPLGHLLFAALSLLAVLDGDLALGRAGLILLLSGYAVSLFSDLSAPGRLSWHRLVTALTRPLYWPLLSLAAYRAAWELAYRPFFWAKTPHHPRETESEQSLSTGSSAFASA